MNVLFKNAHSFSLLLFSFKLFKPIKPIKLFNHFKPSVFMKKLLIFLPVLLFLACNQSTSYEGVSTSEVSVTGTIENPKGDVATISKGDDKFEASLEDGKFALNFEVEKPGYYRFIHGGENATLFLKPADNFSLSLNTDQFDETLKFEGKGSAENNYLMSKFLLDEKLMDDFVAIFKLDEKAFTAKLDDNKKQMTANLKDFEANHPGMNPDFLKWEQAALLYSNFNNKLMYPEYHQYYTKDENFAVSANYYNFLKGANLDDGSLLEIPDFNNFVPEYFSFKAKERYKGDASLKEDENGLVKAHLQAIAAASKSEKVKNYAYWLLMKDQLFSKGANIPQEVLTTFHENCTNAKFKTEIGEQYEKWQALAMGEIAPGFSYPNIDGDEIGLRDFKGKYVYLDVWATWCGPCMRELPHLEKLEDKYMDNNNIVFASISIDENKKAWKKMVTEKKMKGVQLFADAAWNSGICKDYLIEGIPRFILIEPEGKIMNAKAPRPSSDKLKKILSDIDEKTQQLTSRD